VEAAIPAAVRHVVAADTPEVAVIPAAVAAEAPTAVVAAAVVADKFDRLNVYQI
jgi:hypothetical protein